MTRIASWIVGAASYAALLGAGGAALAMGGGGGGGDMGGGSMPSETAPQYDAATEFRNGMVQLQASNYRAAARSFQHVVEVAPTQADAWFRLGQSKAGLNDWRGAQRAFERSIRLDAGPIGPHRGLGVAAARQRNNDVANTQLTLLQQRLAACATTCAQAGELAEATAAVTSAIAGPAAQARTESLIFASAGEGDHAYGAAVTLINQHRYAEALTALDTASAAFGAHPDVLTYQGYVWRHLGRNDRAEAYYRQALAVAPNHIGAMEYYGELKVLTGDTAGARALLARLDTLCTYGCIEAVTLRRWIDHGGDPAA